MRRSLLLKHWPRPDLTDFDDVTDWLLHEAKIPHKSQSQAEVVQRLVYKYVRDIREADGLDDLRKFIDERDRAEIGRTTPRPNDFLLGFALLGESSWNPISKSRRSKYARLLAYADMHRVDPSCLFLFTRAVGPLKDIKGALHKGRVLKWAWRLEAKPIKPKRQKVSNEG